MRSENLAHARIGAIGKNNFGSTMKVIEYQGHSDILVKFDKGKPVHTSWQAFCKGNVRYVYDLTVYGVGYIGEGEYMPSLNRKDTPQYKTWSSMIKRCYSKRFIETNPAYLNCSVTAEWHNFQNFAKWYDDNYYEINGETICLDKDILKKGNKEYSPDTCVFVPESINKLFIKNEAKRGYLPVGVYLRSDGRKHPYQIIIGKGKNRINGKYKTLDEAFQAYKIHKEALIKKTANEYKNKIPLNLYEAMLNYNVEIND
ncbi:hypothetical protein [Siminovitchia fordii]|uniref:AP2/ERF domain-containing protein n=1 Tax=Siminovitchia fordii TaxID=254759 RepID=A0ABQ4KAK8_9BACI|nr:hypothetical protein [Siminovitchia fordii]GIN22646.1 hypothetical protein J1TS3_37800 [Siminovitchia fordii]